VIEYLMAQLIVRNLDPELVARLKLRAAEHGRSVEAEHREILRQALAVEPRRLFKELAAKVRSMTAGRVHTPSEVLLREGCDER
jgi:plasmid stability protein